MLYNVIIIAILVVGVLGVAIASIVILSNYAGKQPNGKVEVNFKLFGCSFGAKASTGDVKHDDKTSDSKGLSIVKKSS